MIEILEYAPQNKGNLLAYVSVKDSKNNRIIRRIRHLKGEKGEWFSLMQYKDEASNQWLAFDESIDKQQTKKLLEEVRLSVKEFLEKKNQQEIPF